MQNRPAVPQHTVALQTLSFHNLWRILSFQLAPLVLARMPPRHSIHSPPAKTGAYGVQWCPAGGERTEPRAQPAGEAREMGRVGQWIL